MYLLECFVCIYLGECPVRLFSYFSDLIFAIFIRSSFYMFLPIKIPKNYWKKFHKMVAWYENSLYFTDFFTSKKYQLNFICIFLTYSSRKSVQHWHWWMSDGLRKMQLKRELCQLARHLPLWLLKWLWKDFYILWRLILWILCVLMVNITAYKTDGVSSCCGISL